MSDSISTSAIAPTRPDHKQKNSLPTMLGVLFALAIVCVFVWLNRGTPDTYNPPPAKARTSAEIQKSIDDVKADSRLPLDRKQGIVAMMQSELEKAKARESVAVVPAQR